MTYYLDQLYQQTWFCLKHFVEFDLIKTVCVNKKTDCYEDAKNLSIYAWIGPFGPCRVRNIEKQQFDVTFQAGNNENGLGYWLKMFWNDLAFGIAYSK